MNYTPTLTTDDSGDYYTCVCSIPDAQRAGTIPGQCTPCVEVTQTGEQWCSNLGGTPVKCPVAGDSNYYPEGNWVDTHCIDAKYGRYCCSN